MLPYGVLSPAPHDVPLALGLLKLCTEGRPERSDAIHLIRHAYARGVRVFDTADSYALDDKDAHYGERLAREALEGRSDARVITKVGMARPKGRWVPAARPERLRKQVDRSLVALGVDTLFLLLLHAVDPAVPYEDQLGALADLQRAGKVRHLGLCNVDIPEIRQAERHFVVAAVQDELSVVSRAAATDGTFAYCAARGIPFLAMRPFGGHAKAVGLEKNRAMKPIADRHGVSRHEAAIATLLDLGPPILPLFGATRAESVDAAVRAAAIRLDQVDRDAMKISFQPDEEAQVRLAPDAETAPHRGGEVVIVMGIQGAGKTSFVERAADHLRLNRDQRGGSLADLLPPLREALAGPNPRVILDNTYPTRVSRWPVVRAARAAGVPARCVHVATSPRDALINVVNRVIDRYDRLLGPDELKELGKTDPNLPPPAALQRYVATFEPPGADEGFDSIETIPFARRPGGGEARGLLLDVDGTLRVTRSGDPYPVDPDDIAVLPGRTEVLRRWIADGYRLFFVSNQSGVASGKLSADAARACFDRTIALLDVPVDEVAFCPHPAFPAGCFCRKPMPGMGVWLARRHGLDLSRTVMVGDMDTDRGFADALGVAFHDAAAFFAGAT